MLRRIVSGGQTGVDRAALDAAQAAGLARGGWCPAGRAAEDGPIPARYPLRETPEARPEQRTAWNVRDADATLILLFDAPRGGTASTAACARETGRPLRIVRLGAAGEPNGTRRWLAGERVVTLNVAGPRESEAPGIAVAARTWLDRLLGADEPISPRGNT